MASVGDCLEHKHIFCLTMETFINHMQFHTKLLAIVLDMA